MTIAAALLLVPLVLATVSPPTVALAQQSGKTFRVGYVLMVKPPPPSAPRWGPITDAFLARLASFGYIEGKNLVLEMRLAGDHYERLPELAAELVRLGVDVIFVSGTRASRIVNESVKSTPLVIYSCDRSSMSPDSRDRRATSPA